MNRLARCAVVVLCSGLCAIACTAFSAAPDAKSGATDAAAHTHAKDGSVAAEASAAVPEAGPPTYREIVLGDGPISFFEFDDEEDPSTGILDSVTGKKKGDVVHHPDFTTPPLTGGSGHSATFDGGSWIVLDNTSYQFTGNAPYTVEAWIQQTDAGGFQHVFTDQDRTAGTKRGYALTIDQGALGAERFVDDQGAKPNSTALGSSVQYVALVYDGKALSLYLNGALVDATDDTRTESPHIIAAVIAAADPTDGSYAFKGTIDELAIYGKALPAAALAAHYLAGKQQ
jgi:hypothetical protein